MENKERAAVDILLNDMVLWTEREEIKAILDAKKSVTKRFQAIFSKDNISRLKEEDFRAFLTFESNQHWSGLHRHAPKMCADMKLLRTTLKQLLYGTGPIEHRFDNAISNIDGMGKAVMSAILLVVFPNKYGVWNMTSESAMKELEIWPRFPRGSSIGERYVELNKVYKRLRTALSIDLWTLDALWWSQLTENTETQPSPDISGSSEQLFGLERHLHDFLWDNWDKTTIGKKWKRYEEEGETDAGYEYVCGVGKIDILARRRKGGDWLVVELKRNQTSDTTVGQILRYMGWVKAKLARGNEKVQGLIIAHKPDKGLLYALQNIPEVDLKLYEVEFHLKEPPKEK